ncbi:apolipoprotein D and lipocalin family protein [Novosphingobium sp. PhB165]|uniref:lipocalin family protein n=1 Tax=Novosphingobium sp. PhB165 TaxID=2485105 RepID=UPI0010439EE8|nr:lipocalin family protein [Novosphingobium sp. PhB165]TCM14432.1 apolipoprotein D and lipocalin family protein [Novosphingobium sp. PhB165]
MRKSTLAIALAGTTLLIGACAAIRRHGPVGNHAVPQPAKLVDVQRYMGRWYEQYRYEASFEKEMDGVTAEYSLEHDGTVRVVNRGQRRGKWKESIGKAKIVDAATNAKLKVSFFGPFYGNYWVLDHDDDYQWSIVGEPSGRYLWVLTRDPRPSAELLSDIEGRVKSLGYDRSLLRRTQH